MLRSLWAWTAIALLVVFWLPMLAVIRLFDRDPAHYRTGRWFRRLGYLMTRVNPAWTVKVSGAILDDPRRPYLVVCNHQSLADIPVVSCLPWEMKWVAKAELFDVPFVGRMMRLAGDIPVDRDDPRSGARALMAARDYLKKRCSVIIFPEGTRSRDGRVLPFSDAPFALAVKAGVPVLPIAVEGTKDALPKHTWRFGSPPPVHVKVLPAIDTTGMTKADVAGLREDVRNQIMAEVATWRGVPQAEVDAALTPTLTDEDQASVNTRSAAG